MAKKTLEVGSKTEVRTAVDYVKDSAICTNPRYGWIEPAVKQVLRADFDGADLDHIVTALFAQEEQEEITGDTTAPTGTDAIPEDLSIPARRVKRIKCIEEVRNVGLLNCTEPFELNEGLNVFFGKNASGKSTLYVALCNSLGKSKSALPNIDSGDGQCSCELRYVDDLGEEHSSTWTSGTKVSELDVKVFDNSVCNSLVREDQVNEFAIAHLRSECFGWLHELFDKVHAELGNRGDQIESKVIELKERLDQVAPFIFDENGDLEKSRLTFQALTNEEKTRLTNIEKEIEILKKQTLLPTLKNLENARRPIATVLETLGREKPGQLARDSEEAKWDPKYDNSYFDQVNERVGQYIRTRSAYESAGKAKLPQLVPKDWVENQVWKDFVAKSVQFVASLNEELQEKYRERVCLYCQQSLRTAQARELISAYHELQEEYETRLASQTSELREFSREFDSCVSLLRDLPKINRDVEAEFETIGKEGTVVAEQESLLKAFETIKAAVDVPQEFTLPQDFLVRLTSLWEQYVELWRLFSQKIKRLQDAIGNQAEKCHALEKEATPLQHRRVLDANKQIITQYVKSVDARKVTQERLSDLTSLRRVTSTLKTHFSEESTLKEFKGSLEEQYKSLSFCPPKCWSIHPVTRDGVNRRVYSLGDRKLADIFSEGEKTIHALADFLAQCEVEKYNGVYIFDDPVNSLDEDNIHIVAESIKSLVDKGNQVLVFTHCLPFLHSLIDPETEELTHIEKLRYDIIVQPNMKLDSTQFLKRRFQEIERQVRKLSEDHKCGSKVSEFQIRSVYDNMSGYMETWVEKKLLCDIVTRYRPNLRMGSLAKLSSLDVSKIPKAHKFYECTSRGGLRHSQPDGVASPSVEDLERDFEGLKNEFRYKR